MNKSGNVANLGQANRRFRELARNRAWTPAQLASRSREQLSLLPPSFARVTQAQVRAKADAQLQALMNINARNLYQSNELYGNEWERRRKPVITNALTQKPIAGYPNLARKIAAKFPKAALLSFYWKGYGGAFFPHLPKETRQSIYESASRERYSYYGPRWMPVEGDWGRWLPRWLEAVAQPINNGIHPQEDDNKIALVPYDAACLAPLTQSLLNGANPPADRFNITIVLQAHTFTKKEAHQHKAILKKKGFRILTDR